MRVCFREGLGRHAPRLKFSAALTFGSVLIVKSVAATLTFNAKSRAAYFCIPTTICISDIIPSALPFAYNEKMSREKQNTDRLMIKIQSYHLFNIWRIYANIIKHTSHKLEKYLS